MEDKQILTAAIKKAVKNGLDEYFNLGLSLAEEDGEMSLMDYVRGSIFRHDFAKAFWKTCECSHCRFSSLAWGYHLQLMVLEEEPLKYIEQFLT